VTEFSGGTKRATIKVSVCDDSPANTCSKSEHHYGLL
jgi:hypothetical protein